MFSSHAGEACTSDRQPVNGNSDSYSRSCLCERSLSMDGFLCCYSISHRFVTVASCVVVGIYGGFLLGVRSVSGLAFYDWESNSLVRRIEITPKMVRNAIFVFFMCF